MQMAVRQSLSVHGVSMVFTSPVAEHHRRLREDYGLFFLSDSTDPDTIDFTVGYTVDQRVTGPAQMSFLGVLGDTVTVYADGSVSVTGPAIDHEKAYESEVRAYFTAAVLREVTRRRTANLFHASAVAGERGAVVFAGAKKVGKSSFAMLCALAGANYISNDMTVLSLPESPDEGDVVVLGLPQPITLAPGAIDWFGRRHPTVGLDAGDIGSTMDATSLYTLEIGAKSRVTLDLLERYTTVRPEPTRLGTLIFPEPILTLDRPRARLLDRDEALIRLSMLAETFLKWHWPVAHSAEEYLKRLANIMLTTVDAAPAWHLQWCPDHDLNYELIREIAL
ncbi:hypothetical protein AB0893_17665 [Micromonospora aurantiaca]|uniref:hypothetical protein n=1 Tax=Micromonospora aurantiaca (nom. illeg.) TaxID=47850 RepID=UPI0034570A6B